MISFYASTEASRDNGFILNFLFNLNIVFIQKQNYCQTIDNSFAFV